MGDEAYFEFECVNNGQPFPESKLPKLPPKAVKVVLEAAKEEGIDKPDFNKPEHVDLLSSMATDLVYLTLRRIKDNPCTVTKEAVEEYEDFDEVMRCFNSVIERNPALFPQPKEGKKAEKKEEDPTSDGSEPAESTSEPSKS